MRGPVDPSVLKRALHAIGTRHGCMRTNYMDRDGELRQIVRPPHTEFLPRLDYEDWSAAPGDDGALVATIAAFIRQRFDLTNGPVVIAKLIRLTPTDHALIVVTHHIVYDGPTGALFYGELADAYRSVLADPASEFASEPLPFQLVDVTTYLQARLDSAPGRADVEYWRTRFADVPALALPVDFARDEVDLVRAQMQTLTRTQYVAHFPAGFVALSADTNTTDRIIAAARREHVTMLVYLLAGLGELLHRETGQDTFAIQTALDVRPMLAAEPLMGGFNSPVFVRVEIGGRTSRRDLLVAIREAFAEAYAHALVSPMQLLPAHLGRVNFGFVGEAGIDTIELGDAVGSAVELELTTLIPFDLRPQGAVVGGQLSVAFQYNALLFRRETCEGLCARYLDVLRAIADDPGAIVAR